MKYAVYVLALLTLVVVGGCQSNQPTDSPPLTVSQVTSPPTSPVESPSTPPAGNPPPITPRATQPPRSPLNLGDAPPPITPQDTLLPNAPLGTPGAPPPGAVIQPLVDTLRVRVVPSVEALPLFAAQATGAFSLENVSVSITPTANSALLLQTTLMDDDDTDVVLTDLATVIRMNAAGADWRIVRDLNTRAITGTGETTLVIAFRTAMLDDNPERVRAFVAAIDRTVDAINQDPDSFRALIDTFVTSPMPIGETVTIPTYPDASVPSEEAVQATVNELTEAGEIDAPPAYDNLVDARFISDSSS